MTALQVLGPSAGGIRVHVATLARELTARDVTAPVVGPAGVLDGIGELAGVVPVPGGVSLPGLLRARRALGPWRSSAQVLHAHGLKAAWVGLGGRPRRPLVVTVHNVVLDETAGRWATAQRTLERRVLASADRVIALTTSMAQGLAGTVRDDRVRVVLPASPEPVVRRGRDEVRAALGVAADAPLVVCATRLHPQKDLTTLLRAWRTVAQRRPDAALCVVGEGPQRGELEALARQLGVDGSARFTGRSAHAIDELAAADVAVMTSVWEGASIVLAECTQLGVPLVSTPVGMAPDLLDGTRGGLLVPVGDPDAVAGALLELIDDPHRAAELGARGRTTARDVFAPGRSIDAIIEIYKEVIG